MKKIMKNERKKSREKMRKKERKMKNQNERKIDAIQSSKKKEKEIKNKDVAEKIKGPFVRNKVNSSIERKPEPKAAVQNEKHINKFSYMGKLANLSILRKPKPVHKTNGFKTELLDFGNMSYEEYKNIKNAQK